MLHLNKYAREAGGIVSLLSHLCPECYEASSIQDFLNEKNDILFTSSLLPPASFLRNAAVIGFPWLNFEFKRYSSYFAQVSDVYGQLEVCCKDPSIWLKKGAEEIPFTGQRRIYEPKLVYRKKKHHNGLYLIDFKLHGPQSPDVAPDYLQGRLMAADLA